jgi:RNA-binding protein YlmH
MAITSEKDLQTLRNRLHDLADQSFRQNLFTFTGFLGLSELDLFWQEERTLRQAGYTLFGGAQGCDRVVIRFGSPEDLGYEEPFPIVCLHVAPKQEKFADDLTHRDFLGALMSLGVDRSTLGDIRVGHRQAYLFCLAHIAPYLCESLEEIRHTRVTCRVVDGPEELPADEPEERLVQVVSPRLDATVAHVYNLSRSELPELLRTGRVFVNGRLCDNPSRTLKEGETVNVRGFGKFTFLETAGQSRKGKWNLRVAVYR